MVFSGFRNLTSISIPSKVTIIESGAFYECSSLASVYIPASVKTIEGASFYGCDKLMYVKCDATNAPECEGTVWSDATLDNAQLIIPSQAINNYKNADGWCDFQYLYNSAVEITEADSLSPEPIYVNLDGSVLPSRPSQKGIYIKISGSKREKVILP